MEALSAEVVRAKTAGGGAEARAETSGGSAPPGEARADALGDRLDGLRIHHPSELKAGRAVMTEMHARELAVAQHDAQAAQQAAAELRQADKARKARGLVARLRAAWRGR